MVFNPQEDLDVYNELSKYQDIADEFSESISTDTEISIKQKQEILFPMIDKIKEMADEVIDLFIDYLNDKDDDEKYDKLMVNIDKILEELDLLKNKVYEIYKTNEENQE